MNYKPGANEVKANIETKLSRYFGCSPEEATKEQLYKACAMTVRDILTEKRQAFKHEVNRKGAKRVYYMCMEFLVGRSLKTNIHNLALVGEYTQALKELGVELSDLYECEPDAGLGNGGLGRLAACYMDSLSSLDYPATGFSILSYRIEGQQGTSSRRCSRRCEVRYHRAHRDARERRC